jgi:hypothetical protein
MRNQIKYRGNIHKRTIGSILTNICQTSIIIDNILVKKQSQR